MESLDFGNGGREAAFRRALREGIALFCGAGFSVEACDKSGRVLPVGEEMLDELKARFREEGIGDYKVLSHACDKLVRTNRAAFERFIDERFAVGDFDERYLALLNASVRRIYTTNVDDLLYRIYVDNGPADLCFLDRARRGDMPQQQGFIVQYAALHGCVRQPGGYVFGTTEIASAFARAGWHGSWEELARDAAGLPILFWGWNFSDHDAMASLFAREENLEGNPDKWVLLRGADPGAVDYLQNLGFGVIAGDTSAMLDYLAAMGHPTAESGAPPDPSLADREGPFGRYIPPKADASLPSLPLEGYFTGLDPQWAHVYSGSLPLLGPFGTVENHIANGDDVVIAGMRGSGKTTLLMQVAALSKSRKPRHFMTSPTSEEVERYLSLLAGREALLLVDCCFSDSFAVRAALGAPNVQLVCADRDFYYDRQYYRVDEFGFKLVDVTELSRRDGQRVLDSLPGKLTRRDASTRCLSADASMVNLLSHCMVAGGVRFLDKFFEEDRLAASVFLMICYVHSCGVACSFDMIFSYLNDGGMTWRDMLGVVERIGRLVRSEPEIGAAYELAHGEQDYYECRSRGLAERIIGGLGRPDPRFREMLVQFTSRVPAFKICRYDLFRRSAYDSAHARRAFGRDVESAEEFYRGCELKDDSEYIYQQAAVYCEGLKEYKRAFAWIERARNLLRYNKFSIDSTYARIYFHANVGVDVAAAEEALGILQGCCESDERKSTHFNAYAELAIEHFGAYGLGASRPFLENARAFVREGLEETRVLSAQSRKRLREKQARIDSILDADGNA